MFRDERRVGSLGDVPSVRLRLGASGDDRALVFPAVHRRRHPLPRLLRHRHRRRRPCPRSLEVPYVREHRHTVHRQRIPFLRQGLLQVHTYWKRPMISLMSDDEYSYSFLLWPKITTATSTEQSTESSCAFLNSPPLRLRKVTLRLRSSRTVAEMSASGHATRRRNSKQHDSFDRLRSTRTRFDGNFSAAHRVRVSGSVLATCPRPRTATLFLRSVAMRVQASQGLRSCWPQAVSLR